MRSHMSTIHEVEVLGRDGAEVVLRVIMVHPDGQFPISRAFAVRLLNDADGAQPALKAAVERGESLDHSHASELVASVEIVATRNWPDIHMPASFEASDRRLPRAVYRIVATQAAWVEHLRIGNKFGSAAYG
jgi:hypothetical protein